MNTTKSTYNGTTYNGKNNSNKPVMIVAVLLTAVAILFLLRGCEGSLVANGVHANGLIYDSSAVEGGWIEADTEEIIASLNEKVEQGMINISMNTAPVFDSGSAAGNLMIVNDAVNNYPQVVEITRNDTGECIYKSGGIPVGSKIENAKLSVDLPAGRYECTAMFHNVDPDTGNSLGCAGAVIVITVKA